MALSSPKLGSMAPGLNNRLKPTELGVVRPDRSTATYLSTAENIDLSERGNLKRRRGYAQALAGGAVHSVWGDAEEGYCAMGSTIRHLVPAASGLVATPVVTGLPSMQSISFTRLPTGEVAWSNGYRIGRLRGATALPMTTPRPAVTPTVTVGAGGLPAGRYQVAFTEMGAAGESGSTVPVQVDVPEFGGIQLSGLTTTMQVYVTGPNGAIFNRIDVASEIVGLTNSGAQLQTLLLADMPPGSVVRQFLGSLLVANGPYLVVSEPYRYGLYKPSRGYLPFPAPITIVEPCETGIYVCADQTYWLEGPTLDSSPRVVLPYGGLPGSGGSVETTDGVQASNQSFWMSPRGLIVAAPGGQVNNVQEHALKFDPASGGATLFREQDGEHYIIASRQLAYSQNGPIVDAVSALSDQIYQVGPDLHHELHEVMPEGGYF